MSAPWRSLGHAGVMIGLTGLFGVVYALIITYRARRLTVYRNAWDIVTFLAVLQVEPAAAGTRPPGRTPSAGGDIGQG
jgi:hypothetical protein